MQRRRREGLESVIPAQYIIPANSERQFRFRVDEERYNWLKEAPRQTHIRFAEHAFEVKLHILELLFVIVEFVKAAICASEQRWQTSQRLTFKSEGAGFKLRPGTNELMNF
ncbi:hypothetical protein EVAR_52046_1 [Eumeta japonica]|uniref:Uncharacterized protein n=1 Tax=Eumeta variegata TaxID=151549 RepID=A0A4C1Z9G1_EUMVA|nr:hypothetical protein EVAR_52046_1 [Eumeta japonica]